MNKKNNICIKYFRYNDRHRISYLNIVLIENLTVEGPDCDKEQNQLVMRISKYQTLCKGNSRDLCMQ